MADQPKAMTLREAVEIVRLGLESYIAATWSARDAFAPGWMNVSRTQWRKRCSKEYDRARAIVDAAVEAHEAHGKFLDAVEEYERGEQSNSELAPLMERADAETDKLRALERGEDA